MADADISDDARWLKYGLPILRERLLIYAGEPRMLGRSYLHAAQSVQGSSVPYEEVESLLNQALKHLDPEEESCRFPRHDALDLLAYCADRACENLEFCAGDNTSKIKDFRALIRKTLKEAYVLDPDSCLARFDGDEDSFFERVEAGFYYR